MGQRRLAPLALIACAALLAPFDGGMAVAAPVPAGTDATVNVIQPLPADLEAIRAREATALYGSPEIRPVDQRQTSIVTMGDSEISGEGQGPYEYGTNGDDDGDGDENWCHRSVNAAVHRTGIAVNRTYNLACSGAQSQNLVYRSGVRQWDELNQGDYLAIKARNTRIRLVWIMDSANDPGGVEFGPVVTDCTISRLFFLGECWPTYSNGWQARVDVSGAGLESAIRSVRQTMTDAGYLNSDYQMIVMSYPSPASPDVEDNPNFPGWLDGGCMIYLRDMAFARNKAVPLFERAIRRAAVNTGVRYLDASRLFHGHETCTETTWVTGLTGAGGDPFDGNNWRQSYHPNYRGHGAFASCVRQFYDRPTLTTGTCFDPASTNAVTFVSGSPAFQQVRNAASGFCVDSQGYSTRNGYDLLQWTCHGGSNQGWWRDSSRQSLHIELTHDRCADIEGGVGAGRPLIVYNCHGGSNQKFTFDGALIRSAASPTLCVAVPNTTQGARLVMAACNSADARQQWYRQTQTGTTGFNYNDWIPSSAY